MMCGTQRILADAVDATVLLGSAIDRRLGADLPIPEIDMARAGQIAIEVFTKGTELGFWGFPPFC